MKYISPAHFMFENMTSWLVPHITECSVTNISDSVCGCCGQSSTNWPNANKGVKGHKDSYGTVYDLCTMCMTLFYSNADLMGVERAPRVPNKFGMWASVGALIEKGKTTLFMPQKIKDKLPDNFPLDVQVLTGGNKLKYVLQSDVTFPCLFIDDLGKKKAELMASLEVSYHSEIFYICKAEETTSFNLAAIKEAIAKFSELDSKEQAKFKKLIKESSSGAISPMQLSEAVVESEALTALTRIIGPNPEQRNIFLKGVS